MFDVRERQVGGQHQGGRSMGLPTRLMVQLVAALVLTFSLGAASAEAALPDKVQDNLWGITEWVYRNTPPDGSPNMDVVAPDCHQVCGRLWDAQQALGRPGSEIVRELLTLATESGVWNGFFSQTYAAVGSGPHYLGNKIGSLWRDGADPHTWLGIDQPPSTVPLRNVSKGDVLNAMGGSGGEQAKNIAPTLGWVAQDWQESNSTHCGDGDPEPPSPGPAFEDLTVGAFCYWWNEDTQKWVTEWGGVTLHVYFAEMMFDGAPRASSATYAENRNMQKLVGPDQGFGAARSRIKAQMTGFPADYLHLISWLDLQLGGPGLAVAPDPADLYGASNPAAENLAHSCAGDPVNCVTGNFSETYTDTHVAGRGITLSLGRTYNSQAAASSVAAGPFGHGWSASFFDSLSFPDPSTVVVHHANGSEVIFRADDDGSRYYPATWIQAKLAPRSGGGYTYSTPDRTVMVFDSQGHLQSETDVTGNQTTMAYVADELTTVTDATGRQLTFTYNPDGTVATVTDPASHVVSYDYASGNLVGVTDAAGRQTAFAYDSAHQITSIVDPRQNTVVANTYDAQHRVIDQEDALGHHTTWAYDNSGTTITQPSGTVIREDVENSVPTRIEAGVGTAHPAVTELTYDEALNPVEVTDPNGHVWIYEYDARGNRTKVEDPLGNSTQYVFDALRQIQSITMPDGHLVDLDYDAYGHVSRRMEQTSSSSGLSKWYYQYYDNGQLTLTEDPAGHQWRYNHDQHGNLTSVVSPLYRQTRFGYDINGLQTSRTSPKGNANNGANAAAYTTTTTRDATGLPLTVTAPGGRVTTFGYDANGNVTDVTDPQGRHTQTVFDALNRPIEVHRPDGTVWKTAYDTMGAVASQTDGAGKTTTYSYDSLGRVETSTDPLGRVVHFAYDPAGNRVSSTDARGKTTTYDYDDAGALTDVVYDSGGPGPVHFTYDANGRRSAMTDDEGTSTYHYDFLGRLTDHTAPSGQKTTYTYDLSGRLSSIGYPDALAPASGGSAPSHIPTGTVTRSYDDDDNLVSVTDWLTHTTSFGYDDNGNLTSVTRPNGVNATYGYNATDALTALSDAGVSQTLARNDKDLLSGITDPSGTSAATYDDADRLTGLGTSSYAYDDADNLTQLPTTGGALRTQQFDIAHQLMAVVQGGPTVGSYTYNDNGQRTAYTPATGVGTQLDWDLAGALARYVGPDRTSTTGATVTQTYGYDGDGLRQSRTTGGTTSYQAYDRSGALPLMITDGGTAYITGPGGLPIEQITAGGDVRYFSHDQLGSTTALTDAAGATVQTYAYDAYGRRTSPAPTVTNPFQYAGQYTDAETGLQYLRARYYDPETGQFVSRDPLDAQTLDPYAYAGNNPLNGSDPTGLDVLSTVSDIVSSVVPMSVSDGAADILDFVTGGAASSLACNGLTWSNGLTAGSNLALSLVPVGRAAKLAGQVAERAAGDVLSQAGKRRLAKRLGGIPRSASPVAQGGSARTGRWWEYDDVAGERKIIVEHPDNTVHVGRPKPQSTHREGGPAKFYDDDNFGHVGE